MNTQQFRPFSRRASIASSLLTILGCLFLLFGCSPEEGQVDGDPARTASDLCSPACTGRNMGCFFDEEPCDSPPCVGCYERTCPPENPIQSCVSGAICDGSICTFPRVCNPDCASGKHCVAGLCIPNYTPNNVCDPLENCRNQCGPNTGCLDSCERDRGPTCRTCISELQTCEQREGCLASATGCCADTYCKCYPGSSECSGKPCASCWNNCQSASNVTACFNQCANTSAACAACLQPFNANPACKTANPPAECEDLFFGCIE